MILRLKEHHAIISFLKNPGLFISRNIHVSWCSTSSRSQQVREFDAHQLSFWTAAKWAECDASTLVLFSKMLRVTLHSVHPLYLNMVHGWRCLVSLSFLFTCMNPAHASLRLTKQLLRLRENPCTFSLLMSEDHGPSEFCWNRRFLRRLCSCWMRNRMPPVRIA